METKTKKQAKWLNINEAMIQIHPTWGVEDLFNYMIFKKIMTDKTEILSLRKKGYVFRLSDTSVAEKYGFLEISIATIQKLLSMRIEDECAFYMIHLDFFCQYKMDIHHVTETLCSENKRLWPLQ